MKGKTMGGVRHVPIRTAARLLCCSRQRVYELIGLGKIAAQQYDGTWLVSLESISFRQAALESARIAGEMEG